MSEGHEIVGIGQFQDTTFEIIQVERGGEKRFFYRLIVDGKITITDDVLYTEQGDCLDAVIAKLIPDDMVEVEGVPGPTDFEALNQLLTWTPENGAIESLFDAILWHNRLFESLPNLDASKVKSIGNFRDLLGLIERTEGRMSDLYRDTMMLRDIMLKQYEMCLETSNRDLNRLASFIEHFLGSDL